MKQNIVIKKWIPIIALLLLSLILANYGSNLGSWPKLNRATGVNMTLAVDPNPPGIGPSHLVVTLTNQLGKPIEGANLEIIGTLPQENIELRLTKVRAETKGSYGAPFRWAAGGDWTVTIKATLSDGRIAEREFQLTVLDEMILDMGATEGGHQDLPPRIPNQGATIRIVSPQDGAIFKAGTEIRVEIETQNFTLGEEGRHWHIYVNDRPGIMIMGTMTGAVLRNLEPGEHQISAYLSIGRHEELEEGAKVTITIVDNGEPDVTMK